MRNINTTIEHLSEILEDDITIPGKTAVLQNQEDEIDNNLPSEEGEQETL